MPEGFNLISLSHPAVNPRGVSLEAHALYQWTINHRAGAKANPPYSKIQFFEDKAALKALDTAAGRPDGAATANPMEYLSTSGN